MTKHNSVTLRLPDGTTVVETDPEGIALIEELTHTDWSNPVARAQMVAKIRQHSAKLKQEHQQMMEEIADMDMLLMALRIDDIRR